MSPRSTIARETRVAAGVGLGAVSAFLAWVHHGDALVVGFALVAAGFFFGGARALRTRPATRFAWRWTRRALTAVAALVLGLFVVMPIGAAIWLTQAPREHVRSGDFAVPHRDVSLRTRDGLALAGWWVPSRNGAAVVVVHGGGGTRNGASRHAELLARHGYGVLRYDARGNGESEGRHDAMGWTWEPDVVAAVDFLAARVEPGRIGALGLSTGAEAVLQRAAHDQRIAAVVSDGAIARNLAETRQLEGVEEAQAVPYFGLLFASLRVLTGHSQPPPLQELVPEIAPRPVLLVATPGTETTMNRAYHRAAPETELWELRNTAHTRGLQENPAAYERHIIGFFDRALLDS
jgi:pimeloyl-ACP methyl ester carboxylesterase